MKKTHRAILSLFALVAASLNLTSCGGGGGGQTILGESQNQQLVEATIDDNDFPITDLDQFYSDNGPLDDAELYEIDPGAYEQTILGSTSMGRMDINKIRQDAAKINAKQLSAIRNNLKLGNSKSAYVRCYAVASININGIQFPLNLDKYDGLPDDGYLMEWALGGPKAFIGPNYYKINIQDTDASLFTTNTVYFVNNNDLDSIKKACNTTLLNKAKLLSQEFYNTTNNISINNLEVYAAKNARSYDHALLPLNQSNTGNKINTLIAFGDSLSDRDSTANFTQWLVPTRRTWFTGHFTNGWTWPEYAANKLDMTFYNQAWGGSGIVNEPLADWLSPLAYLGLYLPGINTQVNQYNSQVTDQAPRNGSQTLYTFLTGGNDFIFYNMPVDQELTGVENAIVNLIKNNNGKNIIVLNLPDLSKAPIFSTLSSSLQNSIPIKVAQYNQGLASLVTTLNSTYSNQNVNINLFDVNSLFADIVSHPKDYGLINVTSPCLVLSSTTGFFNDAEMIPGCTGNNYLFWDYIHPTTAVHKIIGNAFAAFAAIHYHT